MIEKRHFKKLFSLIFTNGSIKEEFSESTNCNSFKPTIDLKDIAIINSFPVIVNEPVVLNVGCGKGRIDHQIFNMGYKVFAVDKKKHTTWNNKHNKNGFLKFCKADIYDLQSFPIKKATIVICSQVLEHLKNYKVAIKNLLELAENRLIITVPFEKSFGGRFAPPPEGHCNFWSDRKKLFKFKNINEFKKLCKQFSVSISKIRTKREDKNTKKYNYLIVVDKTQDLISS